MELLTSPAIWLVVALVIVAAYVVAVYNKLVTYRNRSENGFAQIDVQLKRRLDLIPNLVETAKGYLKHERETLEAVIAARNEAKSVLDKLGGKMPDAGDAARLGAAEALLGQKMGSFQIAVEAYPDLKASQNMVQLSEELSHTENKVAFSRQAYNDAVTSYNTYRESFPTLLFASMFGHPQNQALLEFEDRATLEAAPQVTF